MYVSCQPYIEHNPLAKNDYILNHSYTGDVSTLSSKISCLSGKSLRNFPVTNSNRPEGMRSFLRDGRIG